MNSTATPEYQYVPGVGAGRRLQDRKMSHQIAAQGDIIQAISLGGNSQTLMIRIIQ
jgi:hypothetical protein